MDSLSEKSVRLEALMPLIQEELAAGKTVRFSPRGTSMLPMLRQGIDRVVLSALPETLRKYDIPLYQRENGQYVLHRIVDADRTITCMGDNQFEAEAGLRREQMIAVVTGFTRGRKEYTTAYLPYRIYCRFWHYSRPVRRFWRRGISWLRRHLP